MCCDLISNCNYKPVIVYSEDFINRIETLKAYDYTAEKVEMLEG